MNAEPFREDAPPARDGVKELIRCGLTRILIGAAAILLARIVWRDLGLRAVATLPLLAGLCLVLHFGVFNLVAGLWRAVGVDCRPLFDAPLAARSVGEFWSRRWNLAFSEMTRVAVYRPLVARIGRTGATLAAFAFSGVLHELAISYPVGRGYGLPMLYFALHGGLVAVERRLALDRHPALARVWTLFWLAAPLPLLFHPPFLDGVVWPLIGMETRR